MPLKLVRGKNLVLLTPEMPVWDGGGLKRFIQTIILGRWILKFFNNTCPCFYIADIVTFVPILEKKNRVLEGEENNYRCQGSLLQFGMNFAIYNRERLYIGRDDSNMDKMII